MQGEKKGTFVSTTNATFGLGENDSQEYLTDEWLDGDTDEYVGIKYSCRK